MLSSATKKRNNRLVHTHVCLHVHDAPIYVHSCTTQRASTWLCWGIIHSNTQGSETSSLDISVSFWNKFHVAKCAPYTCMCAYAHSVYMHVCMHACVYDSMVCMHAHVNIRTCICVFHSRVLVHAQKIFSDSPAMPCSRIEILFKEMCRQIGITCKEDPPRRTGVPKIQNQNSAGMSMSGPCIYIWVYVKISICIFQKTRLRELAINTHTHTHTHTHKYIMAVFPTSSLLST